MLRAAWLAGWLVVGPTFAASHKPFVDCTREELVQAVPDLAGIQFDTNQDRLKGLLQTTGKKLEDMLANLVDVSAAEDVNELRFEDRLVSKSRRQQFRYFVKEFPSAERFSEARIDATTGSAAEQPATIDYLVLSHFLQPLKYLLPGYQPDLNFRYLGEWTSAGQDYFIVAFAQPRTGDGLVWIDAASRRIARLRIDMPPGEHSPFEALTSDMSLTPVTFQSVEIALWLPARVTVDAIFAGGAFHTVHRFSDYRLHNQSAGVPGAEPDTAEDALEQVARAGALMQAGKTDKAVPLLRQALARNADLPAAHYNLGDALRILDDLAGAQTELAAAAMLVPESAIVHNSLGIVLSKRGDVAGAAAEFRKSVQIQPKQATVRFNLAQALEKTGDRAGALEEYRAASELAPHNALFKTRYEHLRDAAKDTTITVDVRQVLVPVIVTDKAGHHVTGLKKADFHVFEDGVEQQISAFSVESIGTAAEAIENTHGGSVKPSPSREQAMPERVRRSYMICIDSLHGSFANLVAVRKSLQKLFQSEQAGDSQYVVVAVGTSTQVLQDTTSDPQKVLEAINSKEFQKVFLASRKTASADDVLTFRRKLDQVRAACDAHMEPDCQAGMAQLPSDAQHLASEDEVYNRTFLSQLRFLVQQLSRAGGRRTMILISDGFLVVPGKEGYELLIAYFPELRMNTLRTVDRMPDLEPVLRLAANSNIPIYTIDSRGLYTPAAFDASTPGATPRMMPSVLAIMSAAAVDAGATLSEIAAATGGTAFQNSNDLSIGMERAFADGRQYYMLAYVPGKAPPDGRFRAISVKLRDTKLVVTAKRGYWAVGN